jgi:hypothetical protein
VQRELAPPASLCRFQAVPGRAQPCPEERCPFWEPGSAVLEGRCAFDRLDRSDSLELAAWHLRIRRMLEAASTPEQEQQAWRLFDRVLNERSCEEAAGLGVEALVTAVRMSVP